MNSQRNNKILPRFLSISMVGKFKNRLRIGMNRKAISGQHNI